MSQFEKLLRRIRFLDKGLRFEELKKVLEFYGYSMSGPGTGSSHMTFRKKGCHPITIPVQEPIKPVYIRMVKEIVESEENHEQDIE